MTKLEFPYLDLETDVPEARALLNDAKQAWGMVPNLLAVMANAPPLGRAYMALGNHLAEGPLTGDEQNIALLVVSRSNGCDYCMGAHTAIASMSGMDAGLVAAIRDDLPIADARLEAFRQFVQAVTVQRGWLSGDQIDAFTDAGYEIKTILEVIQVVAMKTLSNYTNHLANTRLDEAFAAAAWPNSGLIAADVPPVTTPTEPRLTPLDSDQASKQIQGLFDRAGKQFGLLPNVIRTIGHSPALLNSALDLHAQWQQTSFTAFEREFVQLTLARANACDYCVSAHSMVAGLAGVDEGTVKQLREQQPLADARLEQLRLLTTELVERRGWLRPGTQAGFLAAGYSLANMLEVVLAQGLMVCSTYTNHLLGSELDEVFVGHRWQPERPAA